VNPTSFTSEFPYKERYFEEYIFKEGTQIKVFQGYNYTGKSYIMTKGNAYWHEFPIEAIGSWKIIK